MEHDGDRINYPFAQSNEVRLCEGLHLKTKPNQDISLLKEVVNNFDWLERFIEANPFEKDDEWSESDALWM